MSKAVKGNLPRNLVIAPLIPGSRKQEQKLWIILRRLGSKSLFPKNPQIGNLI